MSNREELATALGIAVAPWPGKQTETGDVMPSRPFTYNAMQLCAVRYGPAGPCAVEMRRKEMCAAAHNP